VKCRIRSYKFGYSGGFGARLKMLSTLADVEKELLPAKASEIAVMLALE
jgi:hypothetical protein